MEREIFLSMLNGVHIGNNLFFVDNRFQGIFKLIEPNYIVEYIGFDKEHMLESNLYTQIAIWKEDMIIIPRTSKQDIFIFNKCGNYYVKIPLEMKNKEYEIGYYVQNNEFLYIFTVDPENFVIRLDCKTKKIETWVKWTDINQQINFQEGSFKYIETPRIIDGKIVCVIPNSNLLIEIDLLSKKYHVNEYEKNVSFRGDIYIEDNKIWSICDNGNKLVKLENRDNLYYIEKEVDLTKMIGIHKTLYFIINKNVLWMFPRNDIDIVKIDLNTSKTTILQYPDGFEWINDARYKYGARFSYIEENRDMIYLYPRTGNGILIINKKTDQIIFKVLKINISNIIEKQIQEIGVNNIKNWEGDIDSFINILKRRNVVFKENDEIQAIGKKIWFSLKNIK